MQITYFHGVSRFGKSDCTKLAKLRFVLRKSSCIIRLFRKGIECYEISAKKVVAFWHIVASVGRGYAAFKKGIPARIYCCICGMPGSFERRIADYAGLSTRRVPGNNDGGLMVRVPKSNDAGAGEDLVQLNFFPIWNQGNMVTSLDGGRSQKGNMLAWDAHRHLQIIRKGDLFFFRSSPDGSHWQNMPGSPVERKDMAGLPLQVGLYHASYGAESSFVDFSDFRLITRK